MTYGIQGVKALELSLSEQKMKSIQVPRQYVYCLSTWRLSVLNMDIKKIAPRKLFRILQLDLRLLCAELVLELRHFK